MKLGPSKKIYISLIPFFGISAALIFLIVLPSVRGIKENSQQLLLEREAQSIFSQEIENIQDFKITYHEIKPDLEKLEKLFIVSEVPIIESINFLEEFELIASDENLKKDITTILSSSVNILKPNSSEFQKAIFYLSLYWLVLNKSLKK